MPTKYWANSIWPSTILISRAGGVERTGSIGLMHVFKLICRTTFGFFKNAALLPQAVAVALQRRRRRFAFNVSEAERLDRIRNPSKYLGK